MKFRIMASLAVILVLATACVKDEVYVGPPTIETVTISPATPQSTEPVVIKAKITDLKAVNSVKLFYRGVGIATSFTSLEMISLSSEQYMYAASIPAFPKDTKVEYYIEVLNLDNVKASYPKTGTKDYTIGASTAIKVVVNEIFANGDAANSDWIEIYNDSEVEVDLSGYAVYDDGIKTGVKPKRIIAEGVKIAAKGFLVLNTDIDPNETILFGLSTTADAVYLENKDGLVLSEIKWDATILGGTDLKSGKSFGRKPDGSNTLVIFANTSKGSSNNNAN